MREQNPEEPSKVKAKIKACITRAELEELADGLSVDDLIESVDETLLFLLFNAHELDMEVIKGHPKSLHVIKKLLKKIAKDIKE